MNRIYKVKFSKSLNQFIVVSELARGKVKSSSNNKLSINSALSSVQIALTTISILASHNAFAAKSITEAQPSKVYIETNADSEGATGIDKGNILIGKNTYVKTTVLTLKGQQHNSNYSSTYSSNNIVIGVNTSSAGQRNIVLGNNAFTWGNPKAASSDQIAIGTNAIAAGQASVALGLNTYTNSINGIAIGSNASAGGKQSISIGYNANSTTDGIAIGSNTSATYASSIALGEYSITNEAATKESNIDVNGISYEPSHGGTNVDKSQVLSIGNATLKRQIKNVAPGKISSDSTDAINGSQLYSITKGLQERAKTYFHVNSSKTGNLDLPNATASATGTDAIAAGPNATASEVNSIALGLEAKSSHKNAIALGANSQTSDIQTGSHDKLSFKDNTNVSKDKNFSGIANTENGTLSIGQAGKERQIHHVAAGRVTENSTDAINGSQLYAVAKYTGFNILENGAAKSRVNNDNTVNFTNGSFTTAQVTGDSDTTIKFNVVTQNITSTAAATPDKCKREYSWSSSHHGCCERDQ